MKTVLPDFLLDWLREQNFRFVAQNEKFVRLENDEGAFGFTFRDGKTDGFYSKGSPKRTKGMANLFVITPDTKEEDWRQKVKILML